MALIINRLYFPRKFCSLTLLSSSGVRGFLLISILQSFASSTFSSIIRLKRTQQFDCFFQFQRLRVYCVTRYFSGENSPRSLPNICEDLVPDTDKGANLVFYIRTTFQTMRMICQYHFNHNLNSFKFMLYCNANFQLQSVLLSCGYNCSNMDVCLYSVCIYCIDISCPPEHTPQILDASPGLSPSLHPPFIRSQRKQASLPSVLNTQYL